MGRFYTVMSIFGFGFPQKQEITKIELKVLKFNIKHSLFRIKLVIGKRSSSSTIREESAY